MIDGVVVTKLKRLVDERGEIRHALRITDECFQGFGEAYFSAVNHGVVKGWKKHQRMHSNLIVVSGCIRFVLFDDRPKSATKGMFGEYTLSLENYERLTIPFGIWLAFQGISNELNLLLNLADIVHDPSESLTVNLDSDSIPEYDWDIGE